MNRYTARELVTFTPDLSNGAARLYDALDEYGRQSGICWPRQRTLRERIGCSRRSLQYWLAELIAAGLCSVERSSTGGPNRYHLYHAQQVAPPCATDCAPPAQQVAPHIRNNTGIEYKEAWRPYEDPETPTPEDPAAIPLRADPDVCGYCHGRGEVGSGLNRGKCNICTGSGNVKVVRKRA